MKIKERKTEDRDERFNSKRKRELRRSSEKRDKEYLKFSEDREYEEDWDE